MSNTESKKPPADLQSCLIEHEGLELKPYQDSKGNTTIGIGRNLDTFGITQDEAFYMLKTNIAKSELELSKYDWFASIDKVRRDALVELNFNMGHKTFLGFKRMIKAIKLKQWSVAAYELVDSQWAIDVGDARSMNLFKRLRDGKY